jgi:predicted transcriptional regulator
MTKRAFGELELAIQQLIKAGTRVTVKEITHLLGDKDKYTTVMTVMHRMAQKKILKREKVGLHYEYWLNEAVPSIIKKKLMGIKPLEVMAYLAESPESVTDEEIAEMEDILKKLKKRSKE